METDVVVVGAGPTGLLLAGDLAEAGVRVTMLERRTHGSAMTRAFAVHGRTMEELEIRGLAGELAATGTTITGLRLFDRVALDLTRLPGDFASLLITPQTQTEQVLARRLERLGVPVVHDAEVVGVTQDDDGVEVRVRTSARAESDLRAAYLVGADGVNSGVRTALGLPYPGRSVIKSIMLADVRLASPPEDVLTVNAVGDAFAFVAPFGDGYYRIFAWNRDHQVDDSSTLELEEIREVTRRALGTDLGMHDARWTSRFHSDERQVPRYRVGRAFLAGDAAHCHSPAGGQGMNTGLQDAANLGWKLAAAVHGWGGDELLDSYQAERHPVGRQVLRSSGLLIRLALIRPAWGRALRNAAVGLLLSLPPVAAKAAGSVSALGVRYPPPAGADRRVGTRAPDVPLRSGRLYPALRGGRFVLLGAGAETLPRPEQVDAATPESPMDRLVLVRPDGYVGWVGSARAWPGWAAGYFGSPAAVSDGGQAVSPISR